MENLYTWFGTAACANTCMCLLTSFMALLMAKIVYAFCARYVNTRVCACVRDNYLFKINNRSLEAEDGFSVIAQGQRKENKYFRIRSNLFKYCATRHLQVNYKLVQLYL